MITGIYIILAVWCHFNSRIIYSLDFILGKYWRVHPLMVIMRRFWWLAILYWIHLDNFEWILNAQLFGVCLYFRFFWFILLFIFWIACQINHFWIFTLIFWLVLMKNIRALYRGFSLMINIWLYLKINIRIVIRLVFIHNKIILIINLCHLS